MRAERLCSELPTEENRFQHPSFRFKLRDYALVITSKSFYNFWAFRKAFVSFKRLSRNECLQLEPG